jgi:hypothetical protein
MSNVTYVRWKYGEPRRGEELPPPPETHAAFAESCVLCDTRLGVDEHARDETDGSVVLLAVGADDDENKEMAAAGKWHRCAAVIVHKQCADVLSEQDYGVLCSALVMERIQRE